MTFHSTIIEIKYCFSEVQNTIVKMSYCIYALEFGEE